MRTVSVPITNLHPGRVEHHEEIIRELKRMGANRVFLCLCRSVAPRAERDAQIEALRKNMPLYQAAGFEVATWMSSLGHGGPLVATGGASDEAVPYQTMVGFSGETCDDSFCPLDDDYAENFSEWIAEIARAGVKMIMLDDDYRLSYRDLGMACTCPKHMAAYRKRIGEDIAREEIGRRAFTGGANKYRDAWLDLCRDTLVGLAQKCRAKLDKIDPSIRLGFCSCLSTWDVDGCDAIELTNAFAGRAKPFLRTIGAPYWNVRHNWGARLGHIVELNRMEAAWCKGTGIELFAEGDVYPRPRFATPAAFLECYDQALLAADCMDGILKYVLDYSASPRYETGYIDRHVKNEPTRKFISEHFHGKTCVGVKPVLPMRKIRTADYPDRLLDEAQYTDRDFFSMEQRMIADNSLPSAYEGDGVRFAFGENAKALTDADLALGVVTDIPGAAILTKRGVDVGLARFAKSESEPICEHFLDCDDYVALAGLGGFYEIEPNENARIETTFLANETPFPGSYRYENASGQRFLVFAFDAFDARNCAGALCGNLRRRQLLADIPALGAPLPAACDNNPYLYLLAKRGPASLALGVWNHFEDESLTPVIHLDRPYARATCYGCEAELRGADLLLKTDIAPYAFAGFELYDE